MRMRKRSQCSKAGSSIGGELDNGSQPSQGGSKKPSQLRSRSSVNRSSSQPSTTDSLINAFWQGGELCLVVHDPAKPGGVRIRRVPAEHSCFVSKEDGDRVLPGAKQTLSQMVKRSPSSLAVVEEGDWYRYKWRDRDTCRNICDSLHKKGVRTYEGGISPVLRHMVDTGLTVAEPRKCWVDIETDSRVPFSRAVDDARILCWVVSDGKREFIGMLNEDTDQDERRLLRELWAVLDNYDLVAAWNGDRFDFPVIHTRTKQRRIAVETRRWQWLDHLLIFQRMNMNSAESGEEKQSMKLDAIAHAVLGVGKNPFDASKTWQEWAAGGKRRADLLAYCAQDTRLMPQIETKTGYIELLRTLGNACGTFADTRGANPSVQVEGFLQRLAHKIGHKFETVLKMADSERYEGAYVMEPTCQGITKNVHVADFSGLYPSIIVTWNMSPETRVKQGDPISDPNELDDHELSFSPLTKVNFSVAKVGILPMAVAELMRLRKHWNELKASLPPGSAGWKDADRKATAYKIAANSFYGVIGSPMSRFFDRRVAESVAQCGKWLILKTIQEANLNGMDVVYCDTDSVFVAGATRTEFEVFVEHCNEKLYPKVLREAGCNMNLINLAYEKQFERIVFTSMKKYIGRYAHYKGTAADPKTSKPEVKGLEYKRGDAIRFARELQAEVIEMLVGYTAAGGNENPDDYEAVVQRWQDRILKEDLALEDILVAKRLRQPLDSYVRKSKKDGSGFARQLPHIEIARERAKRGHDVGEGVRIEYFVYNGGVNPQDCRDAELWDKPVDPSDPDSPTFAETVDRFVIWDKQTFPPTLRLLEAAFPGHAWDAWKKSRPAKARRRRAP